MLQLECRRAQATHHYNFLFYTVIANTCKVYMPLWFSVILIFLLANINDHE